MCRRTIYCILYIVYLESMLVVRCFNHPCLQGFASCCALCRVLVVTSCHNVQAVQLKHSRCVYGCCCVWMYICWRSDLHDIRVPGSRGCAVPACRVTLASAQVNLNFPYCPCERNRDRAPFYVENNVQFNPANNEYCFTIRSDNVGSGACRNMNFKKFELDASKFLSLYLEYIS